MEWSHIITGLGTGGVLKLIDAWKAKHNANSEQSKLSRDVFARMEKLEESTEMARKREKDCEARYDRLEESHDKLFLAHSELRRKVEELSEDKGKLQERFASMRARERDKEPSDDAPTLPRLEMPFKKLKPPDRDRKTPLVPPRPKIPVPKPPLKKK